MVVNIEYQYQHRKYGRYFWSIDIGIANTFTSGIKSSIDDTFKSVFCRYFDIDTFELMLIKFQLISSLKVN